jgi:uncharacterized membrane protein YhaH (DUF805 family)
MFQNIFSFQGRIRRTDYCVSVILCFIALCLVGSIMRLGGIASILDVAVIPIFWFILAQAVKRSHDLNNSGWFILIPVYGLRLLFAEGNGHENEYGPDPKARILEAEDVNQCQ